MIWSIRRVGYALLAALVMVPAVPAHGQQRGQGRRQDRAELEGRVRARFGQMVQERLGLTEEQSERLGQIVAGFQEDRMRLAREDQALRARTQALLLEEGESEEEALALLGRVQELRLQEAALLRSEQEALLEVLAPSQVLRFHALRDQMGQRIRQLRGGGPGPPGGRRPGGGSEDGPLRSPGAVQGFAPELLR
jgi:Spy/CpxP family protein refolding chaperone